MYDICINSSIFALANWPTIASELIPKLGEQGVQARPRKVCFVLIN